MPRRINPRAVPSPRRPQQLDRSVRAGYEMRLAPGVVNWPISPVAHRADGKHDLCARVCTEQVLKRFVQRLSDFVHGDNAAIEEIRWELVTVGHISVELVRISVKQTQEGRREGIRRTRQGLQSVVQSVVWC